MQTASGSGEGMVLKLAELEAAAGQLDLAWGRKQQDFMVSGLLLHFLFRPRVKDWAGSFPAQEGQWLAYGTLAVIYGLFASVLVAKCGWVCWLFVLQALFMVGCAIYGSSRARDYHRAAAAYRKDRGRLEAKIGELTVASQR